MNPRREGGQVSSQHGEGGKVFFLKAFSDAGHPPLGVKMGLAGGAVIVSSDVCLPCDWGLIRQAPGLGAEKHIPGRLGGQRWWGQQAWQGRRQAEHSREQQLGLLQMPLLRDLGSPQIGKLRLGGGQNRAWGRSPFSVLSHLRTKVGHSEDIRSTCPGLSGTS